MAAAGTYVSVRQAILQEVRMDSSTGWYRSADPRVCSVAGRLRRGLALVAAASCLAACSDAKRVQTPGFADRYPTGVLTGVFKAGNVAGLDFVSGGQSGVTDSGGRFTCRAGESIAFSLGNVDLGDADCVTVVHAAALTASGSLIDPKSINITRFLLLLDHDQVPTNGIEISAALRSLADSWPAVDFTAADFEGELVRIVSDIASTEGRASVSVPSGAEAFAYLDASLSCAYSGLFANTFLAGQPSALTEVALIVYRDTASGTDLFNARLRRNDPVSQLNVLAEGTVELKALPTLINGPSDATGSISADYQTPDVIAGSWGNGIAQQLIDRTGGFEAVRIGGGLGDYRFTGTLTWIGDSGMRAVRGFATLVLDGDTVSGEAFDVLAGGASAVSGRRLANSNSVELTIGTAQLSATAELMTDADGVPVGLHGDWPGVNSGELDAVACRLN
jgi:hypothetical protein